MFQLFKNLIRSLFKKKETFLVLEILPNNLKQVSLIKADFSNKELILYKTYIVKNNFHSSSNLCEGFKKTLKKFGNLSKYQIIVSLNSRLASTIYSSISLIRDNAKNPIDEADLDNLVSQAVWKFFDRHRNQVANKLQVNDFDILLTDVRIENVKLDGHRVINPLGFKARTLEINLAQTFVTRDLISKLHAILPFNKIQLITEAGTAWSHLIAKASKAPKFLLANIFSNQTLLFHTDDFRLAHYNEFEWGEKNLIAVLTNELKIEFEVAQFIIEKYINKQTSVNFARKLEKFLMKELDFFANILNNSLKKLNTRLIYLHSFFDLPMLIFSPAFKNKLDFSVKFITLSHDFINKNYNFNLKINKKINLKTTFGIFAVIFEAVFKPHYSLMTQMAKKRVRWLSPII